MSDFYNSARYRQSLAAAPLHDAILREVLPVRKVTRKENINDRVDRERALWHDRYWGIDAELKLDTGAVLTLSEKCLSASKGRHNSVTIEYMQSPTELGDYFTIRCDLYLVSYMDDSGEGLAKWVLVDLPALKLADARGAIRWREGQNQHLGARASFRYIDVRDLFAAAPQAIIAQSGMLADPH